MTTKNKPMPWDIATSLYGTSLGVQTPKSATREAILWNGESEEYDGEPAAGDYHLHQLLYLNIQAQGEVSRRLDDLLGVLEDEGQRTRKGIRLMLDRLDALVGEDPEDGEEEADNEEDEEGEEEDDDEEEADEDNAPNPTPAPAPPPRRGPRLVTTQPDFPHPVPSEDADAS